MVALSGRSRRPVVRALVTGSIVVLAALAASAGGASRGGPSASAAEAGYGLWPSTSVPTHPNDPDPESVVLGVTFSTRQAGVVTAVDFYQSEQNTGAHTGRVWTEDGRLLGEAKFPSSSGEGWRSASLSSPVRVSAGATYVASYTASHGHYSADPGTLSPTQPRSNRALTATRGVYTYDGDFPTRTWHDSNYFVDVRFVPDAATAVTPAPSPTPEATAAPAPTSTGSTTGKPGPSNTGVPDGTSLVPVTGDLVITQDNTVIDGKDISGSVTVEASGVVIRNSRIRATAQDTYGVYARSGDLKILDSEISGASNGIGFDNWSATRVDIHGMFDDGVKLGSNVSLTDSWIHDMTPSVGAHADGGQMQGGSRNVVVRHNVIDMSSSGDRANAALFLAPDLGPSSPGPALVAGNWLDGGNYTLFCVDGADGRYFVDNISILSNRFGSHANFGPVRVNVPVTAAGNVMDATGAPLTF